MHSTEHCEVAQRRQQSRSRVGFLHLLTFDIAATDQAAFQSQAAKKLRYRPCSEIRAPIYPLDSCTRYPGLIKASSADMARISTSEGGSPISLYEHRTESAVSLTRLSGCLC